MRRVAGAAISHAMSVLARLTSPQARTKRLTTLLRPSDSPAADWAMFVPTCFNAALDIQLTERITKVGGVKNKRLVWTQGNNFQFSVGDVLYDTPLAYERWSDALTALDCCVRVTGSTPQGVTFSVSQPSADRKTLRLISSHTMLQAQFVELLIYGAADGYKLPGFKAMK